ncbi:YjeF-like protein [Opisthorchis viverrini]|uniref:NAD(P)H-hydrate epimerase n=1 Tax=Opisthorchis viverrini TaxID=6198 RepID=A0A1S8XAT1_OPIVI|nr:YjeF-like protein [Opisthorchis viverrini]
MISYLNQADAQQLDNELFTEYAYSVDQLMELAGLSCATAIAKAYPRDKLRITNGALLVCCGPGNNGGDGLVCARHLKMFGYNPTICYPRTPTKQLYKNLVRQCEKMNIDVFQAPTPEMASQWGSSYNLIVDALFGFGFKPPVSAEFRTLLDYMCQAKIPVVSIDVPSGWNVEADVGEVEEGSLNPDCLISLTAPKLCARAFRGRFHFLGGRFVPDSIAAKYRLQLPAYPGTDQCVQLPLPSDSL